MRKILVIAICSLFLITSCAQEKNNNSKVTKVDSDEIIALMDEGAILLDVRSESEYDDGHIPNAVLLNVDDVEEKIENITKDKKQPLIVYCRSGSRSARAAQTLVDMGYEEIYDFGGISNWSGELTEK